MMLSDFKRRQSKSDRRPAGNPGHCCYIERITHGPRSKQWKVPTSITGTECTTVRNTEACGEQDHQQYTKPDRADTSLFTSQ